MNWHPVLTQERSGRLRIWDHPADSDEYVLGIDVAEGKKRDLTAIQRRGVVAYSDSRPDYSAIVVLEMRSGLHVATWHGYVPPDELSQIAAALGAYYRNALLVPELNGPGLAVVTRLNETLRYANMYRSVIVNVLDADPLSPRFGFQTTATSRHLLLDHIHSALREARLFTRDEKLITELRTMEFDNNGTARARGNNKDDLVFALGLALEGRYRSLGAGVDERIKSRTPTEAYTAKIWAEVTKRNNEGNLHGHRSESGRVGRFVRGRPDRIL